MNITDVSVEIQTVLVFQYESNEIFMNAFEAFKIGQDRQDSHKLLQCFMKQLNLILENNSDELIQ